MKQDSISLAGVTRPEGLQGCPFCGRAPRYLARADANTDSREYHALACYCGGYLACAHHGADTQAEAVEKWNRRTPAATAAQPLTDERIKDLYVANHWYEMGEFTWGACAVVVRAIERELLAAATAAQSAQQASADGWHDVRVHGLPPCDGETLFLGENDNGYAGVFNTFEADDTYYYATAEELVSVLSGLRYWRRYTGPKESAAATAAQPQPLDEQRLQATADAVFDHQRIGPWLEAMSRESFREVAGAVIADYIAGLAAGATGASQA